jgi:O-antigen ligase
MNREALDRWCERGILGAVLGILVFGPLATGAVRTPDFLVLQALTLLVMLLWLARLWLNSRPQLLWPPICWAVVAFTVYAIARYFTADIEYVARLETSRVLVYAFLFLAILNNLQRQESLQIIALTLVVLAMAISCYAFYQFITGSNKVWTFTVPRTHRGSGTYILSNHLGGLLEMVLPLALGWLLVSRAKILSRIFIGYSALVILVGIVVTMSRGTWISTGAALLIFFSLLAFHRAYRLPALLLLAIGIVAGVLLVPRSMVIQKRARQLITYSGKIDDDARFSLWAPAVRMWRDNPWWGVGPGHFDYRFGQYRPENIQKRPDHPHNDYLSALADWGVAGTALIASAWIALFATLPKTWFRLRKMAMTDDSGTVRSNKLALVLGAAIGLIAILCHSVVDFNLHIPANAIVAITLMALLTAGLRFVTDRYSYRAGTLARGGLTIVLIAGIGSLGWQGVRRTNEYRWLARAEQMPQLSLERIAALKQALAIEPMNFDTANALGEALRMQSWQGGEDYEEWATRAMQAFEHGIRVNRYDNRNFLGCGLCLDWVKRHDEAVAYLDRALQLDPNSAFTVAYIGWHYVQVEDYAAARVCFERSRNLQWDDNPIAEAYAKLTERKMREIAADDLAARLRRQ